MGCKYTRKSIFILVDLVSSATTGCLDIYRLHACIGIFLNPELIIIHGITVVYRLLEKR